MIVFDPAKDAANISKHGMSLRLADRFVLDGAWIESDMRFDYGEPRWIAYQEIDGRLYVLAFTVRAGATRAISLRKANDREKRYVEQVWGGGSPA